MSDFFASLLDRAEQRAAVLQWRRPSMFENALAPAIPSPMPEATMEFTRPTAQPAAHFAAPSSTVLQANASASATPAAPVVSENVSASPAPVVMMPAAPAPLASTNTVIQQHIHHHAPEIPQPNSIVMPVREQQTIRETRLEHKLVSQVISKSVEPAPSNSLKPAKPVANPPTLAPASALRSIEKIRTIRLPAPAAKASAAPQAQARLTPRVPPAASMASPASASAARRVEVASVPSPAAMPTIQVSIGRIEIKANPSATAPRNTSSSTNGPKMSLDDYLRARTGGRK